MVYYVLGFVTEEQAFRATPDGTRAHRRGFVAAAAAFPHLAASAEHFFSESFDERFSCGVLLWVGGLEARLAG